MSINSEFEQAYAAHVKGDLARAERGYRGLVRSMPFVANHNLGLVYVLMGRLQAAEAAFRAALEADPGGAQPAYALASLLLAEGRYAEGWPLYERRCDVPGLIREPPRLACPEWQGEPLAGKRLLVLGEQGLGDNIMLARFLPELRRRSAHLAFVCPRTLFPIFDGLGADLVEREAAVEADYWSLSFSLPFRLGMTLENLPPPAALSVPASTTRGGIGVVPTGSSEHKNDQNRSLLGRDKDRLLKLGRDLRPEATGARDFAETAAIVAGLDLVISVDTSVAHLAASMGKPTWVLLPARETDWRWMHRREDSPWYATVRLFRQRVAGDWSAVFRRIEGALRGR